MSHQHINDLTAMSDNTNDSSLEENDKIRNEIFIHLRLSGEPCSVREIADALNIPPKVAQQHCDWLVENTPTRHAITAGGIWGFTLKEL